ncbi:alpha/beta hydrolase [Candidatus Woesearchaeota archaeon]|nr:alpha/beta hydrolase [Candidatus Woesearchaeota archaeon]
MVALLKYLLWVLLLVAVLSFVQFLLSIMPPKYRSVATPDDYGLKHENVSFKTSDGIVIAAWWIPGKANKTIVVGHGYPFDKGNILPAVLFLHPEFNLLLYDHRSFGKSSGAITTAGAREPRDVEAAIRWVQRRHKGVIGLYGFSLSAASMLMANTSGVNAIVADSSYASLDTMVHRTFAIFGPLRHPFVWLTRLYAWLFLGISTKDVAPENAIRRVGVPVLLIHGSEDSQIPAENSRAIHANADKSVAELWIVQGADHGEAVGLPEYKSKVKAFFSRQVR